MASLESIRNGVEIARDLLLILGIPGALGVGAWLYKQRMAAMRDQIASLKEQLQGSQALRYSDALRELRAQEEIHERVKQRLQDQLASLQMNKVEDEREIARLSDSLADVQKRMEGFLELRKELDGPTRRWQEIQRLIDDLSERGVVKGWMVDELYQEALRGDLRESSPK